MVYADMLNIGMFFTLVFLFRREMYEIIVYAIIMIIILYILHSHRMKRLSDLIGTIDKPSKPVIYEDYDATSFASFEEITEKLNAKDNTNKV